MTSRLIPSLTPPQGRISGSATDIAPVSGHEPLPVPDLAALTRSGSLRYGMGRVDASGRVSDRSLLAGLAWTPGERLMITAVSSAGVIHPHPAGVVTLPAVPCVVLPTNVRRRCGLRPRDQVLLAADPAHHVLVVHPMAALDTMMTEYHAALIAGETR